MALALGTVVSCMVCMAVSVKEPSFTSHTLRKPLHFIFVILLGWSINVIFKVDLVRSPGQYCHVSLIPRQES